MSESSIVFISNARLSFPHIAEPQPAGPNRAKASYNCELILAPDDKGFARFLEVVNQMAVTKWADKAPQVLQMIWQDRKKRCMGQGAEKINGKTFKPYDGYEGNVYITAGRDSMPQIIDQQGTPVDPANTMACQAIARKMYGGCRVNAAIKPWLQDNTHGRGVRCDLVALQFLADDTPFGEGAVDASAMFTPVAAAPGAAPAMPWAAPGAPTMPAVPFPGAPAGLPSFLS